MKDRIKLFERYSEDDVNIVVKDENNGHEMKANTITKQIKDRSISPPPRPPPPTDYVKDAFNASNYFSLPKNSRMASRCDSAITPTCNDLKNKHILKSSSFSNFSQAVVKQEQTNGFPNRLGGVKVPYCSLPFDDYISNTSEDTEQQKTAGRIIG